MLLKSFKKFKHSCKLVRVLGKEHHRVLHYLEMHGQLPSLNVELFDTSGKLSHLLLFLLAEFEERLKAAGKALPQHEKADHSKVIFSDAEHITAFTQDNRRKLRKSKRPYKKPITTQTQTNFTPVCPPKDT